MKGLGQEISDIYQGPDALSHYLIKRLQTQKPQKRAETLPTMVPKAEDDQVDTSKNGHLLYIDVNLMNRIRKMYSCN